MTARTHRRWGDNDHNLGPFTYARDGRGYRPFAIVLGSGDGDEYPGCQLRLSGFDHTFITALPAVIKPWREKVVAKSWDAATVQRMGRNWYWNSDRRDYGFSCSDGFLQVFLGRQSDDSSTEQRWSKFLPWTQWRHVRHSLYGLDGEHYRTEPNKPISLGNLDHWRAWREVEDRCPSKTFAFADFDGEQLKVCTKINEREWRLGEGWFRWLSWFRSAKVDRSLGLEFSGETGRRKGSWKGGTTGHAITMLPGELHEAAFRRYCAENHMTFVGVV